MPCLMKIQKPGVDTGCSRHQDFKQTNLSVLKFILHYIKSKVKAIPVFDHMRSIV